MLGVCRARVSSGCSNATRVCTCEWASIFGNESRSSWFGTDRCDCVRRPSSTQRASGSGRLGRCSYAVATLATSSLCGCDLVLVHRRPAGEANAHPSYSVEAWYQADPLSPPSAVAFASTEPVERTQRLARSLNQQMPGAAFQEEEFSQFLWWRM